MTEKDDVKRVFSKNKEAYFTSSTHSMERDQSVFLEWLNPQTGMIALDIATGGGHVAKWMAGHVQNVVATDITKDMLTNTAMHLQGYENINYVIADAENLPFLDNIFDIATCRIAAHHFPHPEKFIQEVSRVLKPGGKFLFVDNVASEESEYDTFINTLEKMRDYSHVRSLKISEWKQILQENGLTIMKHQLRKKTLPYEEWITRTLDTKDEIDEVNRYIFSAPTEMQEYHQLKIENGVIQSFAIDEWRVLCTKQHID